MSSSEHQLGRDLNLARVAGAQNPPEIGIAQGHSRSVEIRVIQNVERFTPQLDAGTLANRKLLEHGEVPANDAGRIENTAAGVARAIGSHRNFGERSRVEPFINRANIRSGSGIRYQ